MTTLPRRQSGRLGLGGSGAIAGAVSTVSFSAIHQFLISPIWFALPFMLVAGVLCGACIGWSYALVIPAPSIGSWLRYNGLYLVMFVALGLASLVAFEPVTSVAALLQSNTPPRDLIGRALPLSGLFTLAAAAVLWVAYRPGWRGAGGLLVTTIVLVLSLGLNISILGLVSVPRAAAGVLVEVFFLLTGLGAAYAGVVLVLSRSRFAVGGGPG